MVDILSLILTTEGKIWVNQVLYRLDQNATDPSTYQQSPYSVQALAAIAKHMGNRWLAEQVAALEMNPPPKPPVDDGHSVSG